jgi:hypothetical protein
MNDIASNLYRLQKLQEANPPAAPQAAAPQQGGQPAQAAQPDVAGEAQKIADTITKAIQSSLEPVTKGIEELKKSVGQQQGGGDQGDEQKPAEGGDQSGGDNQQSGDQKPADNGSGDQKQAAPAGNDQNNQQAVKEKIFNEIFRTNLLKETK